MPEPQKLTALAERVLLDLFSMRDLLDIYVGTDEYIIEEEHLSLLRLQDLSPLAIHGLNKRLTKDE